ncbi:hypothetical protein HA402_004538 [Bradysia odoriphaga]|nr:hypothetical protein HA402_004538 [Bradysia odoriphaga]
MLNHFKGSTVLHLLSSTERQPVIEWIINYGAQVNAVNPSTGQTPLHYAMASGAIENAVLLLKHGASIELSDSFQLRPLNYCRTPNNKKIKFSAYETFVWGSNKNYNLGIANTEERIHPQQLDYFKKESIFLLSASISTHHALFLDNQGKVYAVGHGEHGQLGIGDSSTLVIPKLVRLPIKKTECIIRISTARQHSLVLTNSNSIYACGSNEHNQLGTYVGKAKKTPVLKEYSFKEVQFGPIPESGKILGVIAKDYHSVAHRQYSVHAWGKNGGQFGAVNVDTSVPVKLETFGNQLLLVESSNAAIVCCTATNNILIFHKYKMKSIKTPRHETVKAMAILGGQFCGVDGDVKSDETLKILICTESNQLYIWYEDINQYVRCITQLKNLNLTKLLWPRENLIIFVANGNLNSGTISLHDIKKTLPAAAEEYQEIVSTKKDMSTVKEFQISFNRIPKVDRVVEIQCDQLAESFVVLQEHSQRFLDVPKLIDDPLSFKNLMVEASESDSIHDIVFHIDDDIYVAHKFIVFSRARGLRDIVEEHPDKHIYLTSPGLSSKMFELMMKHIYSNHALTLTDVEDIETSMGPFSGYTNLEIFDLFREFAGKFGLSKFAGGVYAQRFVTVRSPRKNG